MHALSLDIGQLPEKGLGLGLYAQHVFGAMLRHAIGNNISSPGRLPQSNSEAVYDVAIFARVNLQDRNSNKSQNLM